MKKAKRKCEKRLRYILKVCQVWLENIEAWTVIGLISLRLCLGEPPEVHQDRALPPLSGDHLFALKSALTSLRKRADEIPAEPNIMHMTII